MVGAHRETYTPGQEYLVDGALLNKYGGALNAPTRSSSHSDGTHKQTGDIVQQDIPPEALLYGVAVITQTGTTCADGPNPRDGKIPPCDSQNFYVCRFRYFHHGDQEWREIEDDVYLDAGVYWEPTVTEASQSPTSGAGYGAIPAYYEGDVVPAFWDEQRGWAVAVQTPHQDVPRAQFISDGPEDYISEGTMETVSIFLERIVPPYTAGWQPFAEVHFRVPDVLDADDWSDTRSGFAYFSAPQSGTDNTSIRMRVVNRAGYEIVVNRTVVSLYGAGRKPNGINAAQVDNSPIYAPGGGGPKTGWYLDASVKGRFKDSPIFTAESTSGNRLDQLGINYLDPLDDWIIGCEFFVNISPTPDSGFSSSSTSSRSSSSSEYAFHSSSSLSDNSSSSELTASSTSSSSMSSEITGSSSSSELTGSSLTSTTTTGYDSDFTCVTVVTSVVCNPDGTVDDVCYRTICFPIPEGLTAGPGPGTARSHEFCVPCETITDMSSESSLSSLSSSSSELTGSSSSSATTSTSSAECPGDFGVEADPYDPERGETEVPANLPDGSLNDPWEEDDPDVQEWLDNFGDDLPFMKRALPTGEHDEDPIVFDIIFPNNDESRTNWLQALDNHTVTLKVLSNTGNGDVSFNEETGQVTYTPPADGSENGQDITLELEICAEEDLGTSSSSSSVTSSSSSLSSTSSSSSSSSLEFSSSSSSASSSSWSSLSQEEGCAGYNLVSPQYQVTVHDKAPIDMQPLNNVGNGVNWTPAITSGTIELTLISNSGAGVVDMDNATGRVTYTPPGDGSESGDTVLVVVRACDLADEENVCCEEVTLDITISTVVG